MNKQDLINSLSIDEADVKRTTERMFCSAILQHCSTYVVASVLQEYNQMRNCIEGRGKYKQPE